MSKIVIVLCFLSIISCNATNNNFASQQQKTIGHIASFFKQSERPSLIVDYVDPSTNRIKFDEIYPNLAQLESNYFAFGFWTTEDRTIYAWSDFREVVSRLQNDKPELSLYLYVGSPEYAEKGSFCWDVVIENAQCQNNSSYSDYVRWAKEAAILHNEFPIVKGILIDDFIYSLSAHKSDSKLFTSDYLDQIKMEGKAIFPDFRIEAIWYLPAISAYHAKLVSGHIDAVHFFYRHYDDSRKDSNPDRLANEIKMFSRSFAHNVSPLISIFRDPVKPATAGNKITVEGTIDISPVQEDLLIGYWDNLYSSDGSTLYGWAEIKIYFENQLLLEQDIMGGSQGNGVQALEIPFSAIQNLKNKGKNQAKIHLEITTIRDYSRWGYVANLFILSPENIPVEWSIADEEESHLIAISNDINTPVGRYLGLYAGAHSAFDISAQYTQRVLSHATHALNTNKIEGLVSWEVMMNAPNSDVFSLYKDYYNKYISPPILISPLRDHATPPETYSWNASSRATWYYVWLQNYISGEISTKWYSAETANCLKGGLCSIQSPKVIDNGVWWIRAWNSNGYSSWSRGEHFTSGKPAKTFLHSPRGSTNNRPLFIWQKINNANWYQLWVEDSEGSVIDKWYAADEVNCAQAVKDKCGIHMGISVHGAVSWWVRGWNSSGYGEWSNPLSFVVK